MIEGQEIKIDLQENTAIGCQEMLENSYKISDSLGTNAEWIDKLRVELS